MCLLQNFHFDSTEIYFLTKYLFDFKRNSQKWRNWDHANKLWKSKPITLKSEKVRAFQRFSADPEKKSSYPQRTVLIDLHMMWTSEVKVVRQRSPQLAQIRFLRFRTCESPLHGSQTPETLFTAHSWCVHAPVARSAPSELRDRAILSLFWCFPYWSRWLTPMDFQWDLVDIFEMTNVSGGFVFEKML